MTPLDTEEGITGQIKNLEESQAMTSYKLFSQKREI